MNQTPVATPVKEAHSPWILGPVADLVLFVGTPLLILPVMWLARSQFSAIEVALFVAAFGAAGHHLPGMMRAYGDRQLFRRFRTRFIVAPVLLLLVCGFFSVKNLSVLTLVVVIWGFWHGLMQTYGFLRIYDAKVGGDSPFPGRLDLAMCVAWFGLGMVFSDYRVYALLKDAYLVGIPTINPGLLNAGRMVWLVGTLLLTLLYVAQLMRLGRAGLRGRLTKLLLMAITFSFWFYCMNGLSFVIVGIAMFEIFHDVQYLSIVWIFNQNRVKKGVDAGRFTRFLFRRNAGLVLLYVGLVFAYGSWDYWDGHLSRESLIRAFSGFIAASALLHFYFDGFIWKIRDTQTRAGLGLTPRNDEGFRFPGWAIHGLKWCCLAVPVIGAGIYQWQKGPLENQALARALNSMPESAVAHHEWGMALQRQGRIDQAGVHYRQALLRDPNHLESLAKVAFIDREQGRTDQARANYSRVLELEPKHVDSLIGMGITSITRGAFDEAASWLSKALREDSNSQQAHGALGMLAAGRGAYDEAIDHYRKVVELDEDDAEGWSVLGMAQHQAGRMNEAAASLGRAVELRPEDAQLHAMLGQTHIRQGQLELAADDFDRALVLEPENVAALINLGTLQMNRGSLAEARALLIRAIKLNPDNANARHNLGLVLWRQKDMEGAVRMQEHLLTMEPRHQGALLALARMASERGAWQEAVTRLEQLKDLFPDDANIDRELKQARAAKTYMGLQNQP